ncbi:MAG: hypothetical protein ABI175_30180 [Polyangiales bacterium]
MQSTNSRLALALVSAMACSVACSATKDAGGPTSLDGGKTDGGSTDFDVGTPPKDDAGFGGDGISPDGGVGPEECPEELKQVYVVTTSNELLRFDPATLVFTKIGNVSCPDTGFSTPFSMAVDRKGTAWVLFNDGHMFHVSTKDASCKATSFVTGQAGFDTFGMAFDADAPGSTSETLYVADYEAKGIAKIDTTSLKLTFVGDYGGASPGAGELTGRGDARLFAFFNDIPTRVAEIDRTSGNVMASKTVPGLTVGSGWAFAHWGGDFWLFTAPTGKSQVTQFTFETGTAKTVKTGLGYVIVGAGVSTCAPTVPPVK